VFTQAVIVRLGIKSEQVVPNVYESLLSHELLLVLLVTHVHRFLNLLDHLDMFFNDFLNDSISENFDYFDCFLNDWSFNYLLNNVMLDRCNGYLNNFFHL
jgi:hypothetical protein